jgi:hypothetical protein
MKRDALATDASPRSARAHVRAWLSEKRRALALPRFTVGTIRAPVLRVACLPLPHDGRRLARAVRAGGRRDAWLRHAARLPGQGAGNAGSLDASVVRRAAQTSRLARSPARRSGLARPTEVEPENAGGARRADEALHVETARRPGRRRPTPHLRAWSVEVQRLLRARDLREVSRARIHSRSREGQQVCALEVDVARLIPRVARLGEDGTTLGSVRGHHATAAHVEIAEELGDGLAILGRRHFVARRSRVARILVIRRDDRRPAVIGRRVRRRRRRGRARCEHARHEDERKRNQMQRTKHARRVPRELTCVTNRP